ncbi:HER186Wp [Eremothecium sinecaudum]|uniref:HER186Wp n=1 Tax=Eremothecium sinecaudum TaxID=45286 RepID=A0A120K2G5_9SACH|nr:HER186Wp [Eremothecium sinecaudum]AMD21465.1 HER186Wp [Eremothecium sinecaudum]
MNIWVAASDGLVDKVEEFLKQPDLTANSKDENGYTPVHAAASYGHVELLRLLLNKHNGDVNIKDNDGDTPLHHTEDIAVAKVLVEEFGADFSITNEEGKTALQVFEEDYENIQLIQYMKEKSGLPLHQDSLGIDKEQLSQFKDSIRYTLENDPVDDNDPASVARRQRLEQILQGENVEQELESYIRETIRGQFGQSNDDQSSKRRK